MYNKLEKIVNEILERKPDQCGIYKDIDLQDLLLALNKLDYIDVKFGKIDESVLIIKDTRKIENADICEITLSKPLSNQKEEVYNKLIEILK